MRINTPWWLNRKIAIATITTTVAIVTTIIRFTGAFETLELKRYDYFFSKRAIASWDERIIIVGYTEDDMKEYGESPPDETLRQVLEKVKQARPTTVGLFFARESEPFDIEQRKLLNQQIQSMPSLIKADSDDRIAPETDNIMRKITLNKYSSTKGHTVWKVAKHYLEKTGASIRENQEISNRSIIINYPNGNESIIKPLTVLNDGGYNSSFDDLTGFQVLISWPYFRDNFRTYSFKTIIDNPPQNFQDKLVIIGEMKPRNIFKAPVYGDEGIYNYLYISEVAGIVISNILQQAEVPFVQVWSDPIEYLYFYGWLIASAIMVGWLCEELDPAKKWAKYIFSIAIIWGVFLVSIYVVSLVAFPKTWIPSVFVGRGLSFNIIFCSLTCLELKVREEQNEKIKKQQQLLEEKERHLKEKENIEKEQKEKIIRLENTLLSRDRLIFFGRLAPFLRHKLANYYDTINMYNATYQIDITNLENNFYTLTDILGEYTNNPEVEEVKEEVLDTVNDFKENLQLERNILQSINKLLDRFLPMIRNNIQDSVVYPESININSLIEEVNNIVKFDFQNINPNFSVQVNFELSDNIPDYFGIFSELGYIFVNILENAYYAVLEKSKVETSNYCPSIIIKSEYTNDAIKIFIYDNGIGISPDHQEVIFKAFFTTKKRLQETMGVGLTLAKDILEHHYNGKLSLVPDREYTCFLIELFLDP